ncbi:unnamed protein product, partial [Rotaria magnacalcarata]
MASKDIKSLVNKNECACILKIIRHMAACTLAENTMKINHDQIVKIMQLTLLHFDYSDHFDEGKRMVDTAVHPTTLGHNFDDVEQLIDILCS